jgi:hypothetical protein
MKATVRVRLDLASIEESLQSLAEEGDYSGMDVDGESDYEVASATASSTEDPLAFDVEVEVERISGKFAPKDEFITRLTDALLNGYVEVGIEEA